MASPPDRKQQVEELPPLTTESEIPRHEPSCPDGINRDHTSVPEDVTGQMDGSSTESPDSLKELHPYSQIIGLNDLESCLKLEQASFPAHQRCSREKLLYRLTKCSELCLGIFTAAGPNSPDQQAATASTANHNDSFEPQRKGILLAHVIATKTTNDIVSDDDMATPKDWQNKACSDSQFGHKEHGRTLVIQSLAVLPAYQGRGLGKTLLMSYVQRMLEGDVADQIALLTYDRLVPFYEKMGFENRGKSKVKFGNEEWNDMVLEFKYIRPPPESND